MLRSDRSDAAPDLLVPGLVAILGLTVFRLGLLPLATTDLFVDETQYWQWGQALDWGYYSKPPLIGWLIRAVTDLAGSDSAFWIRMPGAVLHGATALLIVGAATEITGRTEAALCGIVYLTLPFVAVGSALMSTDTVLLPFFAAATWLWLRLARRPSVGEAFLLGLCLGLGIMAKYAGLYFAMGAAIGALLPAARVAKRDLGIAVLVAAAVVAPNIVWNLQNDLVTLTHTAENVDWVERESLSLHPARAAEFFGSQFLVMGPVLFGAYLWAAWRGLRHGPWQARWLVAMSAPILVLVLVQAVLSRAYANWAVTAFVAATLLTVPALWHRARWVLWAGLALNLAVTIALPVVVTQADRLMARDGERLLLRRYVGRAETSERILEVARTAGLGTIVSDHRDLLADLVYRARDGRATVRAVPVDGPPPHYYAQELPFEGDSPALFVTLNGAPPCEAVELPALQSGPAYRDIPLQVYRVPADCWSGS
ncbi:glycosyl transferase [Rhodobacterales bacterium HKCCE3408]|nr:glycosyl transferase [Rhodobacterales bacterium HKCCE3408]